MAKTKLTGLQRTQLLVEKTTRKFVVDAAARRAATMVEQREAERARARAQESRVPRLREVEGRSYPVDTDRLEWEAKLAERRAAW